ncbi:hypothetical protein CB1_001148007 [Camelus ferus]|nr:hypothetical protein CB1_001148007 [Camelus ferus]
MNQLPRACSGLRSPRLQTNLCRKPQHCRDAHVLCLHPTVSKGSRDLEVMQGDNQHSPLSRKRPGVLFRSDPSHRSDLKHTTELVGPLIQGSVLRRTDALVSCRRPGVGEVKKLTVPEDEANTRGSVSSKENRSLNVGNTEGTSRFGSGFGRAQHTLKKGCVPQSPLQSERAISCQRSWPKGHLQNTCGKAEVGEERRAEMRREKVPSASGLWAMPGVISCMGTHNGPIIAADVHPALTVPEAKSEELAFEYLHFSETSSNFETEN